MDWEGHLIQIYGRNSNALTDAQVDRILQVIVNVASPSRMPVRAKVVLIEPSGRSDFQMCGIIVGSNVHFVGITDNILLIMDLVDVRTSIFQQLNEWDEYYQL